MLLENEVITNQLVLSKKDILQFLPTSLEKLISNREIISYKEKRLKSNFLIDIIHNLMLKYYNTIKNGVGDTEFNLSSIILREKYGANYNYYFNFLIENGIIRLSSNYLVGKKTKTYGLTEYTLKSEIKRFKNTDKKLVRKWRDNILGIQTKENINNYIEPDIKNRLVNDLFSISIDMDLSKTYLERYVEENDIYQKNMFSVESINEGNIFFNFDDYGRMHSNFTILKSIIRKKCLLIDGEPIVEIDIKNSQPIFLMILIQQNLNLIKDKEEFNFFKRSVINGSLYKYFMDECDISDKKVVKELIYKVLFGRNGRDAENLIFKKLFPSIYSFIKLYKRNNGDYRTLAYYLQRSESALLFNNIVKRVYTEYNYIKLFTIHDSICFNQKWFYIIKPLFDEEMNKLFDENRIR